ncbi:MAG: hypothetical protein ACPGYV_01840 [Phycisphaeraceae bacterium]
MDERDAYRTAFRATREGLASLETILTEPQRDAILREATRAAKQKENFWFGVSMIVGAVLYFLFDAIASVSQYKFVALAGAIGVSYGITRMKNRRSRIQLIGREAMAILKRKRLRPSICLACGSPIQDDGSADCVDCGIGLAEPSRHLC